MNQHLRFSATLVAVLALGAIAGVAAFLIAGYGIPVGTGLAAGLVIGLIAGLALTSWIGGRTRQGWTSYGSSSFHSVLESGESDLPDPMRAMERVQRVDHGPLVRVVAGGDTAEAATVVVELIALEIRSAGAIAHFTTAIAPPAMMTASFVDVVVDDDRGTAYEAAGTGGNGSPDRMRYEVRFAPAPAAEATELRIRINAFTNPFPMTGQRSVDGPWELRLSLV